MSVLIDNRQSVLEVSLETTRRTAQAVLNALGCPEGELSVVIVDDAQIAALNAKHLARRGPTNVIAFSMREGGFSEVAPDLLGDVVVSVETAAREAAAAGMETNRRFKQLLIHGILHIFGYDHVDDEEKARSMEARSAELMESVERFSCC